MPDAIANARKRPWRRSPFPGNQHTLLLRAGASQKAPPRRGARAVSSDTPSRSRSALVTVRSKSPPPCNGISHQAAKRARLPCQSFLKAPQVVSAGRGCRPIPLQAALRCSPQSANVGEMTRGLCVGEPLGANGRRQLARIVRWFGQCLRAQRMVIGLAGQQPGLATLAVAGHRKPTRLETLDMEGSTPVLTQPPFRDEYRWSPASLEILAEALNDDPGVVFIPWHTACTGHAIAPEAAAVDRCKQQTSRPE